MTPDTTAEPTAAHEEWQRRYEATPERPTPFVTLSGDPVNPLYTEQDLPADTAACGPSASSPVSGPPRRPTSASAICSTTGRPASARRSTCRR